MDRAALIPTLRAWRQSSFRLEALDYYTVEYEEHLLGATCAVRQSVPASSSWTTRRSSSSSPRASWPSTRRTKGRATSTSSSAFALARLAELIRSIASDLADGTAGEAP
jgi:hypothetical protein